MRTQHKPEAVATDQLVGDLIDDTSLDAVGRVPLLDAVLRPALDLLRCRTCRENPRKTAKAFGEADTRVDPVTQTGVRRCRR